MTTFPTTTSLPFQRKNGRWKLEMNQTASKKPYKDDWFTEREGEGGREFYVLVLALLSVLVLCRFRMSCLYEINRWWRSHVNLWTLYLLFLGQMVSFVLAMGSITSSLVASLGNLFTAALLLFLLALALYMISRYCMLWASGCRCWRAPYTIILQLLGLSFDLWQHIAVQAPKTTGTLLFFLFFWGEGGYD